MLPIQKQKILFPVFQFISIKYLSFYCSLFKFISEFTVSLYFFNVSLIDNSIKLLCKRSMNHINFLRNGNQAERQHQKL